MKRAATNFVNEQAPNTRQDARGAPL